MFSPFPKIFFITLRFIKFVKKNYDLTITLSHVILNVDFKIRISELNQIVKS